MCTSTSNNIIWGDSDLKERIEDAGLVVRISPISPSIGLKERTESLSNSSRWVIDAEGKLIDVFTPTEFVNTNYGKLYVEGISSS